MSSDRRVKEGELLKYRNILHGWKKYYFKLERSYLHYFDGKYVSKPRGTITRGEISKIQFFKPLELNQFEIHKNSGDIWHLEAANHEERMEWMRILQPNAYIVDPYTADNCSPAVSDQSQPSVVPPVQLGNQCTFVAPIYPQLDINRPTTSNTMHAGCVPVLPNTPPPAYDEINYT